MPHVTLQFAAAGPLLDLMIGVSSPRLSALAKAGQPAPAPVRVRGLVDTGASGTCVDPQIIQALGLVPTGVASMLTPSTGSTPAQCLQYDVSLIFAPPNFTFQMHALPVMASSLRHQGFDVLIGRDVLAHSLMVYDGGMGIFSLAF